jgi:hypothetical protein
VSKSGEPLKEFVYFKPSDAIRLAETFPEGAIISSFAEIEIIAAEFAEAWDVPGTAAEEMMRMLHHCNRMDDWGLELFKSLKGARDAAVHTQGKLRISRGEAFVYILSAQSFSSLLRNTLMCP